jgi:hypothetical protein
VGEDLDIRANDALSSLAGLAALTAVGGDVRIENNPALCQSEAETFAAGLTVGGTITVSGNGGC